MKSDLFRQWELKQFSKTRFYPYDRVSFADGFFLCNLYFPNLGLYGLFLVPNGVKILVSYLFLILFTLFLSQYRQEKFSHFLLILLFYSVYLPIGSIYGLQDMSTTFLPLPPCLLCCLRTFSSFLPQTKNRRSSRRKPGLPPA